ncbi:Protein draper [Araneus ventricosus]|uniref:Protein draper n=1 Tax=Araneus ventricosus TaxID=182803 RepID=A0A4Y2R7P5_ARAVE|nr:Protein draper [Araneus ventricosus]
MFFRLLKHQIILCPTQYASDITFYRCDEVCSSGTWGVYCSQQCACQNDAKCMPSTGQCLCTPGWKGTNCDQSCDEGTYGQNCSENCECRNGAFCNPIDGSCNCTSGFKGYK